MIKIILLSLSLGTLISVMPFMIMKIRGLRYKSDYIPSSFCILLFSLIQSTELFLVILTFSYVKVLCLLCSFCMLLSLIQYFNNVFKNAVLDIQIKEEDK